METFNITSYCEQATNASTVADCYVYETISKELNDLDEGINVFFLLGTGALVFLQQAGFAMVCAGMVREKNVVNILLKNLLDSCCGAIGFWAIGYAFAYGGGDPDKYSFIGNSNFFLRDYNQGYDELIRWYFQFAFAQTAATIVAGVIAERSKMAGYLWYSAFITSFVYPVIVHNAWSLSGFMSPFRHNPLLGVGVIDFAGSGCVHSTGGFTALLAAKILGPRSGRFYDEDGKPLAKPNHIHSFSPVLQYLGTFFLWVGWIGFNPGSEIYVTTPGYATGVALSAVTTTLSAASGSLSAMLLDTFIEFRRTGVWSYDVTMVCNGVLAGLVAITANCSVVTPWASVVIGIVGGWIYYTVEKLLVKFRIDDAVDAIPVHLGNGFWGLMATGLLADPYYMELAGYNPEHPGLFYSWARGSGDAHLLACQILDFLFIITWVTLVMVPYFYMLKRLGQFRVPPEDEVIGLDIAHHRIQPPEGWVDPTLPPTAHERDVEEDDFAVPPVPVPHHVPRERMPSALKSHEVDFQNDSETGGSMSERVLRKPHVSFKGPIAWDESDVPVAVQPKPLEGTLLANPNTMPAVVEPSTEPPAFMADKDAPTSVEPTKPEVPVDKPKLEVEQSTPNVELQHSEVPPPVEQPKAVETPEAVENQQVADIVKKSAES